ncbi:prepilin-type N-terminal cleavage/methylation domain-containing protein [Candidatus Sumerlaeota bacterium]|nr:prepilin-type N-terminal cleavage/methylation domain-containing protein [Candidatus Sumerlaeota bacterium]
MARSGRTAGRGAMSLIELITVLALLSVVVAIAAPSLAPFFRGRALHEEARRFLALTRYASNEAVSLCVPIELWIEVESGKYGIAAQAGSDSVTMKNPVEFTLHEGLRFEVNAADLSKEGLATILFQPDGTVGGESLASVVIRDSEDKGMEVAQRDYAWGYELREAEELLVRAPVARR